MALSRRSQVLKQPPWVTRLFGRKSYEDFGKPLPERRNIIVTRQEGYQAAGCEVVHDIDAAIALAYESDAEPFILGGAEIYRVTMPLWTRLFVTEIDADHQGDTYFPVISNEPFIERESRRSDILNFRTLVDKVGRTMSDAPHSSASYQLGKMVIYHKNH